jgi:hypothetical protein
MTIQFAPDRVAALETGAWRAYYDKAWPKLLYLTERALAEQFRLPLPAAAEAAYFATRAAIAFQPVQNDLGAAVAACERYYTIVAWHSDLRLDPRTVARAEVRYWQVHRRLAGAAKHDELLDTFAALHAATYGIPYDRSRESAMWRTLAAITADGITAGRSADVEADWLRCARQLRRCYRALARELEPVPVRA